MKLHRSIKDFAVHKIHNFDPLIFKLLPFVNFQFEFLPGPLHVIPNYKRYLETSKTNGTHYMEKSIAQEAYLGHPYFFLVITLSFHFEFLFGP